MRRLSALVLAPALALCLACAHAPAAAKKPAEPWWKGAVFYEIFVRSFQDSNGDGKGDLPGLVSRLDYLNDGDPKSATDLGVDALWLMPVFPSPSYHGYDVTDYEAVNPDYGNVADLDRLVAEAHRRGLHVILDLVLNHTSDQHPWFVESASSPSSPRRDWYVWRPDDPGWTQPWNPASGSTWHERNGAYYYGLFQGGMPDLNYRTQAVREEAKRIARLWLAHGVDGFRLDAIRYLIETGPGAGQAGTAETHAYLRELAAAVKAAKPDAVLIGEVWSETIDIADYYGEKGDELDLLFDFPLAAAIVDGVKAGDGGRIGSTLEDVLHTYPKGAVDAPFLTNHDQLRIAAELEGDPAKLRLAAAILLTLPGSPFVYYGEELGLRQPRNSDDEFKRTPMPWDGSPNAGFTTAARPWQHLAAGWETVNVATESGDPGSLLSRYRALIRVRHASAALRTGDLAVLPAPPSVFAYVRRGGGETVLVVHNLGPEPAEVEAKELAGAAAKPLLADPGATLEKGTAGWRAILPARSTGIWSVR
jgi:glycosidase